MKHLILGTAGHVDHGKTALIKALTGFDCDTHKAEKERGITINLGFTHVLLPSGNTIGIIDVPGHEDFIHTMVEGAMSIDLGLLVIAANEGIKPQTLEHVNILEILGINNVIIAITKIDMVDTARLLTVKQNIRDFLSSTFLKESPIIEVSAITGDGIPKLINEIDRATQHKKEKSTSGPFRMFIDRLFTKPGFGTIVTGSALSGKITNSSSIFILPLNKKAEIRNIQRFGKNTPIIAAGDRTAINLTGIKTSELKRGMVISDRILKTTTMIDVYLSITGTRTTLRSHTDIMFQAGIYNLKANINILTGETTHEGAQCYAQIKFPHECILRYGDRFIIRSSSGDKTIGGGYILDTTPLHHKKRRSTVTAALTAIHQNGLPELLAQKIRRRATAMTLNSIAEEINYTSKELSPLLQKLPDDIICINSSPSPILISQTTKEQYKKDIINIISSYFSQNPYASEGLSQHEILTKFTTDNFYDSETNNLLQNLLQELQNENQIIFTDNHWTIPEFPRKKRNTKQDAIEEFIKKCGKESRNPTGEQLEAIRNKNNITEKEFKQIIAQLIKDKIIYSSEGVYIHKNTVQHTRKLLVNYLTENEQGITVAEFRDLINGNRKICIALLSLFDNEGTTIRKENFRILSGKARRLYL